MSSRLHDLAVEHLGTRIVSGELEPGAVLRTDALEDDLRVSRSVVREAVRVAQSLGLVETVKRVGIRVLPVESWNVFDPSVIRWRLESTEKGAQLRSLTELRTAVEPVAAELAARFAPPELASELMRIAAAMRTAGRAGDAGAFLELDVEFHRTVLRASGNEMFAALGDAVGEVLRGRTTSGLMPTHPSEDAMQWHVDVADAILAGRAEAARAAMLRVLGRTADDVERTWRDLPRAHLAP
ncbi:FadR/GntR family transcriptional regulator [Agromyces aurantiacus]|uniref:FadR/GntR family transcriptional regulator n=1 Tax=Agromyces aurantiacus TaxID=165814 RepID=A0ABV9RBT9_9MICO|nr:FCD domain-containing protein [Agromyces aurantiacus]MBM7505419.1 DNA-binding FadR family transcriptional regulator [Agromyces aurantiacus]